MGRRRLTPASVLDPVALESAFEENGIKKSHMKTIWELVCRRALHTMDLKDILLSINGASKSKEEFPRAAARLLQEKFVSTSSREKEWVTREPVYAGEGREDGGGGKLIIELQDGQCIETVIIEHPGNNPHSTVCVSSQVGCKMGCTFCATGTMGLQAQLTAGEIAEQVLHAKRRVRANYPLKNIVFMGMGEPLDNYEAVVESIRVLNENAAFGLAYSNITISTVGVVHSIEKLAKDCPGVNLALSLHAPTQDTRKTIVPSSSAFKIDRIMDALDRYSREAGGRQIMIEYIMIDGVNADKEHAHALGALLAGRRAYTMVNLIPYNPTDTGDQHGFRSPSEEQCETFQKIVKSYHRQFDGFTTEDSSVHRGKKGGKLWISRKDLARKVKQAKVNSEQRATAAAAAAVKTGTTEGGAQVLLPSVIETVIEKKNQCDLEIKCGETKGDGTSEDKFNAFDSEESTADGNTGIIPGRKGSLAGARILCTVRWSTTRGRDIDGACGQLVIDQTSAKGKKLIGDRKESGTGGDGRGGSGQDIEDMFSSTATQRSDDDGCFGKQSKGPDVQGSGKNNSEEGEEDSNELCQEQDDGRVGRSSRFISEEFGPRKVLLGVTLLVAGVFALRSILARGRK